MESICLPFARDDAPMADSLCQELEVEHFAALSRSIFGAKCISATNAPSFQTSAWLLNQIGGNANLSEVSGPLSRSSEPSYVVHNTYVTLSRVGLSPAQGAPEGNFFPILVFYVNRSYKVRSSDRLGRIFWPSRRGQGIRHEQDNMDR